MQGQAPPTDALVTAAGLLGLSRGSLSFPSQADRCFGCRFYCLVRLDLFVVDVIHGDEIIVGGVRGCSGAEEVGRGGIQADGAEPVDGHVLRGADGDQRRGVLGGGGVVSGPATATGPSDGAGRGDRGLGDISDAACAIGVHGNAGLVQGRGGEAAGGRRGFSLFDSCYDLARQTEVKVPTVVMHLASGAEVYLLAENYLIPVDMRGTFFFAFAGTDNSVSIIGNIKL